MQRRAGWLLLALAASAWLHAAVPAPARAEGQAEIRIGLAAPLRGRVASVGLAMRGALEGAIAEANASGGVLGHPLMLAAEDDGCAAATAAGAAGLLIALKPALAIGHPCSGAAAAAAALYGQAGLLFIAVGARHPDVTRTPAAPVLRLAGRDDRQGDAAARWLLDHAPQRRVAIIHDRTGYARGIADGAVAALKAAGVDPVALLPIVASKRDYADTVVRLRESHAEAVLFAGYPEEAAIIVSGLDGLGLSIPLLGSDALATPGFASISGKARTRVRVLLPEDPKVHGLDDSDAAAWRARTRGAFEAWLQTARAIGSVDGGTVGRALRGARIATPSLGEIRFDLNGDLDTTAFAAASARDGRWVKGE